MDAREQLPRDHQAVAAVVAFAAQHHDALFRERPAPIGQELHNAMPGVLHQNDAGDPQLYRAPIDLAHLRGSEHLHKRRATSMVISSCSSLDPVHWLTDSMVRAMISSEPACEYLIRRSFKRSSPNISP